MVTGPRAINFDAEAMERTITQMYPATIIVYRGLFANCGRSLSPAMEEVGVTAETGVSGVTSICDYRRGPSSLSNSQRSVYRANPMVFVLSLRIKNFALNGFWALYRR